VTTLLGGVPASRARVQIPAFGLPFFDVECTEPTTLAGDTTLTIGGLSHACAVYSGGVAEGKSRYRLVAGAGGWGLLLPGPDGQGAAYNDDAGVKLSSVLTDAAKECGETLGTLPTTRLGPHFARPVMYAYELLNYLAPRGWYIDAAGVTQIGARPPGTYVGDATAVRVDHAVGVVELALDALDASLVPGVSITLPDGTATPAATDVEYEVTPDRLTCRVYWRPQRADKWVALFNACFPWLRWVGTFEYRVVTQEGERLNLQPARVATGMPDLARVPVRPGVSGFKSQVKLGELVLVEFADRDGSRPQVTNHDHADSPGWIPTLTEHGDETDFLASKAGLDAVQEKLDDFISKYNTATYPTGVGPSGTTTSPETPVGAQPSTTLLKATTGS
jgi:hypothetical protein